MNTNLMPRLVLPLICLPLLSPVAARAADSAVPEPPLIRSAPEFVSNRFAKSSFESKYKERELGNFSLGPARNAIGGVATTKYVFRNGVFWKSYEPGLMEYSFSRPGMSGAQATSVTNMLLAIAGIKNLRWEGQEFNHELIGSGVSYKSMDVNDYQSVTIYWRSGMKWIYKVYVAVFNERD